MDREYRDNGGFFLGTIFAAVLFLLLLTFKKWGALFGLAGASASAGAGTYANGLPGGAGGSGARGCSSCGDNAKYPPPPNFPTNPSTRINPTLGYAAPNSPWTYAANPPAPSPVNSGDIFLQRNPTNPKQGTNIFGQTVTITPDNTVLN